MLRRGVGGQTRWLEADGVRSIFAGSNYCEVIEEEQACEKRGRMMNKQDDEAKGGTSWCDCLLIWLQQGEPWTLDQSKTVQQVVARGWGNLKAWAPVMKIQHLHSWKFFSPSHSCWCKYTEHCLKWCFPQSKRRQQSFYCCFLVGVVKAYLIFIFFLHSRNLRPRNFTLESA